MASGKTIYKSLLAVLEDWQLDTEYVDIDAYLFSEEAAQMICHEVLGIDHEDTEGE